MSETLSLVAKMLTDKSLTIAFAESATAGRLSADFSMLEDAGKFLKGGIACYDACIKEDLLGVEKALIEKHTPESMEVTRAIAEGLIQVIHSDIHIGITGLTTPGGSETAEKPVGTMFFYAFLKGKPFFSHREVFTGGPAEIVRATVDRCAALLKEHLLKIKS